MSYLNDLPPEILEMVYRFLHRSYMNELTIPYFAGKDSDDWCGGELGGLACPVCKKWIWCFHKGCRMFATIPIGGTDIICSGKCTFG